MIGRIRSWVRQRQRVVALGDMGHAVLWYDPETEAIWQARSRWSIWTVSSTDQDLEGAIRMLDVVHLCDLWADPDELLEDGGGRA